MKAHNHSKFYCRDDYYNPDSKEPNIAELNIAKNRTGATGMVKLVFTKEFTRFENLGFCRKVNGRVLSIAEQINRIVA